MKNSSPISLFSFQDIITSLTGIMIVVVLIILLQLVQTMSEAAARSKLKPEYDAALARLQDCRQKLNQLKKQEEQLQKRWQEYAGKPMAELQRELMMESGYADALASKLAALVSEIAQLEKQKKELSESIVLMRREWMHTEQEKNRLMELQARLSHLKKQKISFETKIEQKRKIVRVEFQGENTRTPILIECNNWGFRCKVHPDGVLRQFGNPGDTNPTGRPLQALADWLRRQNLSVCYPVLLFRNGTFPYHDDIVERINSLGVDVKLGRELLGEGEDCLQ